MGLLEYNRFDYMEEDIMKNKKKFLSLLLLLLLIAPKSFAEMIPTPGTYYPDFIREQYDIGKDVPIRLKLQKYHIIYTDPYGPYVEDGRLMVSIKTVEDLLGGRVIHKKGEKKAKIELYGTTIEVEAGSDKIKVNGKTEPISKKVRAYRNTLLIPLRMILDHTNIRYNYDNKYHQLHITDERTSIQDIVKNVQIGNGNKKEDHAIKLIKYGFRRGEAVNRIVGINVSGRTLRKGESEIRTQIVQYNDENNLEKEFTFESDNYSRGTHEDLPAVKNGGQISRELTLGKRFKENIAYIFVTGRIDPFFED